MEQKRRIEVIAEIANSHQGNPENVIKLTDQLVKHGVPAIKVQIYFADELLSVHHERYEHFSRQSFSENDWKRIISYIKSKGVKLYADIFGFRALEIASENDVDGYKIHSSDLSNAPLVDSLADLKQPVFVATGGSTNFEVEDSVTRLLEGDNKRNIILMHGFQAYPTDPRDLNLTRLAGLNDMFGEKVKYGISDHVDAESIFSIIQPLMAIPYGVEFIEKHVTLDRSPKGVDYFSSMTPPELEKFIDYVDIAVDSISRPPFQFTESETKYRHGVKKNWLARSNLPKGHVITKDDLIMKRPDKFHTPVNLDSVVGSELLEPLESDKPLSNSMVNHKVLAVILARVASSRLKDKALIDINDEPAIVHLLRRIKIAQSHSYVDTIALCTTTNKEDDILEELALKHGIKVYRGDVEDVLSRMLLAVNDHPDHDVVLRITGDDLLIDPLHLHKTVCHHLDMNADYTDAKKLPSGTEVEVFSANTLKNIKRLAVDASGTEYLTNYITENANHFEVASLPVEAKYDKSYRLTLDTPEDYLVISKFLAEMRVQKKEINYSLDDVIEYFSARPNAFNSNKKIKQRSIPIKYDASLNWDNILTAPKVTIYLVNYNYGAYIKESIESVLNQTFSDYELIIIDDGSTDDSQAIINNYKEHPKIKVVFQENMGLLKTINKAIDISRGDYIIRLDADDYLNKNALLILVNRMENNKNCLMVFPDYYLVDKNSEIIAEEKRHNFKHVSMFDQPAHGACTLLRKDAVLKMGKYSDEFSRQDGFDIWIKLVATGEVDNVDLPLFYYRQHGNSLSENKRQLLHERHLIMSKHAKDKNVANRSHIAIIPLRGIQEENFALTPMKNGKTPVSNIIDVALQTNHINKIIVSSPSLKVQKFVSENYPDGSILFDKRPHKLAKPNVRIDLVVEHVFEKYFDDIPDTISLLNVEYPNMRSIYVDTGIDALWIYDADSVVSVLPERSNFFHHNGHGLQAFHTNSDLRLERDLVFRETGGIHIVRGDYFKEHRRIFGNRATYVEIDAASARSVKNVT